jgi:hypothetical protein
MPAGRYRILSSGKPGLAARSLYADAPMHEFNGMTNVESVPL